MKLWKLRLKVTALWICLGSILSAYSAIGLFILGFPKEALVEVILCGIFVGLINAVTMLFKTEEYLKRNEDFLKKQIKSATFGLLFRKSE